MQWDFMATKNARNAKGRCGRSVEPLIDTNFGAGWIWAELFEHNDTNYTSQSGYSSRGADGAEKFSYSALSVRSIAVSPIELQIL
jgi:hypothetical protein